MLAKLGRSGKSVRSALRKIAQNLPRMLKFFIQLPEDTSETFIRYFLLPTILFVEDSFELSYKNHAGDSVCQWEIVIPLATYRWHRREMVC